MTERNSETRSIYFQLGRISMQASLTLASICLNSQLQLAMLILSSNLRPRVSPLPRNTCQLLPGDQLRSIEIFAKNWPGGLLVTTNYLCQNRHSDDRVAHRRLAPICLVVHTAHTAHCTVAHSTLSPMHSAGLEPSYGHNRAAPVSPLDETHSHSHMSLSHTDKQNRKYKSLNQQ